MRQLTGLHELDEGVPGIDTGRDNIRIDLITILQYYAACSAILANDFRRRCVCANLSDRFFCGFGVGVGNRPRSAAGKHPGPKMAVDLTLVMVEQDIRRYRR